jgi:hypothetical protein
MTKLLKGKHKNRVKPASPKDYRSLAENQQWRGEERSDADLVREKTKPVAARDGDSIPLTP